MVRVIWHNREFVEKHYVDLKQKNPTFPFLIRECGGIQSRLYARYGKVNVMKSGVARPRFFSLYLGGHSSKERSSNARLNI